ncbi:DNA-binding protein [Oryzomonas rubra]|uniref:DNA-binding protein n=1 Tax=Oryzomonas rubra TaxID=2509454 RepID=A0A5A9XNT6_9BACT|nr:DNA-binding protein [Oryzomonas rubra]KAA0894253.1 DNA-binding protein [Oryzomonas rubra]
MEESDYYDVIAAAAEKLLADGNRVSVRNVRDVLGGGNPNKITPLLAAWKAGKPPAKAPEISLDPRIPKILAEQIQEAVTAATMEANTALADCQADLALSVADGAAATTALEKLQSEFVEATAMIQRQTGQIMELKIERDKVNYEAAERINIAEQAAADEIKTAKDIAEGAINTVKAELAAESKARETAQLALAKAEIQLQSLPQLAKEIADLKMMLDKERLAKIAAEQAAAVNEASKAALAQNVIELNKLLAKSEKKAEKLEDQVEAMHVQIQKFLEEKLKKTVVIKPLVKASTSDQSRIS